MKLCMICKSDMCKIFTHLLLGKYDVDYFHCKSCNLIQTEKPYWLDEAYSEAIGIFDTGILTRNMAFKKKTAKIIKVFFNKGGLFLDYGGGYGVFTRLMRDIGYDFVHNDPYATNIFAKGFEYQENMKTDGVTAFEVFEHTYNPNDILDKVFNTMNAQFLIFSTVLFGNSVPDPNTWWYYNFKGGQHITLYSMTTLKHLAQKYQVNLYSNGTNFHLFSHKKINSYAFRLITSKYSNFLPVKFPSKIEDDYHYLLNRLKNMPSSIA
ncbi:MAG: class I SAM-dependent methyltransferase [Calditrichaeota bacterium]|nr:MAG: class I SAM-dependent methyltransferase [Calditrichota bacterium]